MKSRLFSAANKELAEATLFYAEESAAVASRFVDEVGEAIAEIERDPLRYRIYRKDVRVKFVAGFPYSIYYRAKEKEIVIVAIAHQARKPNYWARR